MPTIRQDRQVSLPATPFRDIADDLLRPKRPHLLYAISLANSAIVVASHMKVKENDAAVMVLGVVSGKEALAKVACIPDRAEAFRELGSVLQGLELTFRERVVRQKPADLTAATDNLVKLPGKKSAASPSPGTTNWKRN